MLLTIHNLPPGTRYSDIKMLLQTKCGLKELILDNLLPEGNSKKVTVGVAAEEDAAILVRKINGLYFNGQQLYVEDVRKNKVSEQPYRSGANLIAESQSNNFKETNMGAMTQGAMIPMMIPAPIIDYNMPVSGMYYMQSDQSPSFMGYNVQPQVVSQPILQPQYTEYPVQQKSFQSVPDKNHSNVQTNWSTDRGHSIASTGPASNDNYQQRDSSNFSFGNIQIPESSDRDREHNFNGSQRARDSKHISRWENSNMVSDRDLRRKRTPPRVWSSRECYQNNAGSSRHADFRHPEPSNPRTDRSYGPNQADKPFDTFSSTNSAGRQFTFDKFSSTSTNDRPAYDKTTSTSTLSRSSNAFSMMYNKQCDARAQINTSTSFITQNEVSSGQIDRAQNLPIKRKSPWSITSHETERRDPATAQNYRQKNRNLPPPKRFQNTESVYNESRSEKHFGKHNYTVNESGRNKNTPGDIMTNIEIQNKDMTFRGQAVSYIANNIFQNLKLTAESKNKLLMKKLKESVRERVDKLLGNRRLVPPDDIIKMYRKRYPINDDATFCPAVLKRAAELTINNPEQKEPGGSQEITKDSSNMETPVVPINEPNYPVSESFTQSCDMRKESLPNTSDFNRMTIETQSKGQAISYIADNILINLKLTSVSNNKPVMKKLKEAVRARMNTLLSNTTLFSVNHIIKKYRQRYPIKDDAIFYSTVMKRANLNIHNSDQKKPGGSQEIAKHKSDTGNKSTPAVPLSPKSSPDVSVPERTPKYPQGEEKQQVKKDFSEEITYKFDDKDLEKMLEVETEVICDKFMETCVDPEDEKDKYFCKEVAKKTEMLDEFRKMIRLHLSKRLLNIGPILLRIYSHPKRPSQSTLDEFLKPYGVVSLRKAEKKLMYIATFKTYDAVDKLCEMESVLLDDMIVVFKPIYVVGPTSKNNKIQKRVDFTETNQIYFLDDVILRKNPKVSVDFTKDVNIGFSGETLKYSDNKTEKEDFTHDSMKELDDDISALAQEMKEDFEDNNRDVKSEKSDSENDDLIIYEDIRGDFPTDDMSDNMHLIDKDKGDDSATEDAEKAVNDNKDAPKPEVNLAEYEKVPPEPKVDLVENDEDASATKVKLVESDNFASTAKVNLAENDKVPPESKVNLTENDKNASKCNIVLPKIKTEEINIKTDDEDFSFDIAGEDEYPDVNIDDLNEDDLEDY